MQVRAPLRVVRCGVRDDQRDRSASGPGGYVHGHHASVLRTYDRRTADNSAAYLMPALRPGMTLLDVGCGAGSITVDLAERVAPGRVAGLDPSAQALARARDLAAERGVPVEFRPGNALALDLPDDSVDVVHAHQVVVRALACRVRGLVQADSETLHGRGGEGLLERAQHLGATAARCRRSSWSCSHAPRRTTASGAVAGSPSSSTCNWPRRASAATWRACTSAYRASTCSRSRSASSRSARRGRLCTLLGPALKVLQIAAPGGFQVDSRVRAVRVEPWLETGDQPGLRLFSDTAQSLLAAAPQRCGALPLGRRLQSDCPRAQQLGVLGQLQLPSTRCSGLPLALHPFEGVPLHRELPRPTPPERLLRRLEEGSGSLPAAK